MQRVETRKKKEKAFNCLPDVLIPAEPDPETFPNGRHELAETSWIFADIGSSSLFGA
jgi:hypothetical protein